LQVLPPQQASLTAPQVHIPVVVEQVRLVPQVVPQQTSAAAPQD
jgi:hypothetical protein